MTRVVAPGRLHFGLLNLATPDVLTRQYGGAGMMIDTPGIVVQASPADDWSSTGPSAERALGYARRTGEHIGETRPFQIVVEQCPPEHVGLGVGTQLGLAVARAVAVEAGRTGLPVRDLATAVGRGERSAVGVHGFDRGGLIVEGGKVTADLPSPLLARYEVPDNWRIVLARDLAQNPSWAGDRERQAFARLRNSRDLLLLTERMCRILLLGMLPALVERDCAGFGEALSEYNLLAGRMFAEEQHGEFASPLVADVLALARRLGATGAAQSSWGPVHFAICPDDETARRVEAGIRSRFAGVEVQVSTPNNSGSVVEST